jgi:uncharacterized membrane protein HdeD (DUF308 family)
VAIVTLVGHLARNWGWVVLRGFAAIVFGVLAFAWPGLTLAALVLVWGAYALADGVLALLAAFQIRDEGKPMWPLLLVGLIGIGAGLATFARPGMTALLLLTFIGVWAIAIGIFQVIAAFRLRQVIENELMLGLSGGLSILFGVFVVLRPGAGAMSVIWIIACFAILFGVSLVTFGFRLKALATAASARA